MLMMTASHRGGFDFKCDPPLECWWARMGGGGYPELSELTTAGYVCKCERHLYFNLKSPVMGRAFVQCS